MAADRPPGSDGPDVREAGRFLRACRPGLDAVWLGGDARGDRRVDAFRGGDAARRGTSYVLSRRVDGRFAPDAVSDYPHVPYAAEHVNAKPPRARETGAFAFVEEVHAPDATRVRFARGGAVQDVAVIAGHCTLVAWDTAWIARDDWPAPLALLTGAGWVPAVSRFAAATPGDLRRAYIDFHALHRPQDDWVVELFHERLSLAEAVGLVECILEADGLCDRCRGSLAAGPVEDLIGHDLLDHVERDAATRARWIPLLRRACWTSEPADIQQRLRDLLGTSVPPSAARRPGGPDHGGLEHEPS